MATVPGGIFDSSTNTNIDAGQGASISSFITSLGISESQITQITVSTTGTNTIDDTTPVATFTIGSGQTANVVLSGSTGKTLIVTGSGNASIAGGEGGDSVLGGSGSDSVTGGLEDDRIVFGGAGNDIVYGASDEEAVAQALTDGGPTIGDNHATFIRDIAEGFGAKSETMAAINTALTLLSENGDGSPEDLYALYMRFFMDTDSVGREMLVDTTQFETDTLFIGRLLDMRGDSTMVLKGMEKIILVGAGKARIDGSEPAMVVGDTTAQNITGGDGADTLVGGGGADTLTGGAGADEFGFIAGGHYTISDFVEGTDVLAFGIEGVTTLAQLQSFQTSVTHSGGDTTFNFGANASITLVGVDVDALTSDMVKFTIG